MEWHRAFLPLPIYLGIGVKIISRNVLSSRFPFPPHTVSQITRLFLVITKKKSHFGFAKCQRSQAISVFRVKNIYTLIVFIKITYLELLLFICHLCKIRCTIASRFCAKNYMFILWHCVPKRIMNCSLLSCMRWRRGKWHIIES